MLQFIMCIIASGCVEGVDGEKAAKFIDKKKNLFDIRLVNCTQSARPFDSVDSLET